MFKRYWACKHWRDARLLLSRLTRDFLLVVGCDRGRVRKASFMLRGVWEGVRGKYGKMEL
jgi:hypothetical protein